MKRFLALLALVLVLLAGTAGMASADIFTFEFGSPEVSDTQVAESSYWPPDHPIIALPDMLNWHDVIGGHLYCAYANVNSVFRFKNPTYVNSFQMNGIPWEYAGYFDFGPMKIAAFDEGGTSLWSKTVNLENDNDWDKWLTVVVDRDNVKEIIFYARDPAYNFRPSIDNLVINEAAAVPIPASVWLLACGLLRLVGRRRKFTR